MAMKLLLGWALIIVGGLMFSLDSVLLLILSVACELGGLCLLYSEYKPSGRI